MDIKILTEPRFLFVGLMLLLVGCSKEQPANSVDTSHPVEVRLNIKASAPTGVSNNETDMNRLRVVVFGSVGSPDAGRLIVNKYYAVAPAGNSFRALITSGKRDIFILVNEPVAIDGQELDRYKNIATVDDIRNLSLTYQGTGSAGVYTPPEIPMFKEYIDRQIVAEGPNEFSDEVERVISKVTIKLNVKNSYFPTDKYVVIDSMMIRNLPQSSFWIAKTHTGAFVSSETQNASVVVAQSGYDFSSNNTFYVPEYILSHLDQGAYIEIRGHLNGDPTRVTQWRVKLGDAMDDAKAYGTRYDITRNRHYTFTGDVKSIGAMEDLAVKVTVLPWNEVNMEDEVGRFTVFSQVANELGVILVDSANLSDLGETIQVKCNTNVGGWYVVLRNAKGDVVSTSAPTAVVTTTTSQTVDVVIPGLEGPHYKSSGGYSVSILTQASAELIKELTYTQFGSFIPNSILEAAGWPADKLPPTGLQLATRGNVLPGGIPGANDPLISWSTVEAVTGVDKTDIGSGPANYAQLIVLDATTYPIGQACKDLGPEWYVPSRSELQVISATQDIFGTSYWFSLYYYWSSSEYSEASSYLVYFKSATSANIAKGNSNRVRCVRDI